MNDQLKEKLDRVKDEHAVEVLDQKLAEHEERATLEAMFYLGRVKQVGHDARSVYSALGAQEIRALEHFFAEKKHELLGYKRADEFLDKSEFSPMTRRQYYDRLALLREHGDEIFDLLTSVGISVRAQKLLGKGDLAIRGDRLVVGETEVEVANTGVIKEVLEELFDERRQLTAESAKKDTTIEKLKDQIDRGQQDYDELQRAFDAQRSGDPHERHLTRAIANLLELTEVVGQMGDERRAKVAADAMPVLWAAVQRVRKAYKINFVFTEPTESEESLLDSLAAEALAGGEDLD